MNRFLLVTILAAALFLGAMAVMFGSRGTPPSRFQVAAASTMVQLDALIDAAPPATMVTYRTVPGTFPDPGSDDYWDDHDTDRAIHDACVERRLSPDQWDRLIEQSSIVRLPERCLTDEPVRFLALYPRWAGRFGLVRIGPGMRTPEFTTRAWSDLEELDLQFFTPRTVHELPAPLHHQTSLEFTIEVVVRDSMSDPGVFWSTVVSIPIKQVRDPAQVMTPIDDPAITEAIRKSLTIEVFRRSPAAPLEVRADLFTRGRVAPFADQMAMSVRIDVVDREQVPQFTWNVDIVPLDWYELDLSSMDRPVYPAQPLTGDRTGWTVRVRGDGRRAIHDIRHDSYWAGDFTVPLEELVRGEIVDHQNR